MVIYLGRWAWGLGLAGVLLWGEANLLGSPTLAQITPDSTLGTENSVVTPNVNVRGFPAERIEGGAVRGANLFHSFQEFNIGDGQGVYFANPMGIQNILSRVTGNNFSNILGTLGVDGGANLFLLNPNGIIFGPNAKLDIAGSFVASTANSVVFNNGYQFSAKNPDAPPLLSINVPLGVQYGTNQSRTTITNTGNLAVGQNLTLDAGNLDLQGQLQAGNNLTLLAQDTVKIRDSATNPFVAAAGSQLLVQGNQIVDIFALNHPNSGLYSGGDMVLKSPDAVMGDAHYWSGGNFRIEQLDGSLGDLESPNDPVIRASGNVSFTSYTGASLHIFAGGSVNIGSVIITGIDNTNFINDTVPLSQSVPNVTNPLPVNGASQPTLDIRAGTTAVGIPINTCIGCPFFQPIGLNFPNTPLQRADITINEISFNQGNGLVLLTNQYQPNTLPGNIQVRNISTGSDSPFVSFSGNSGAIVIDSRGNITMPEPVLGGRISTMKTNTSDGNSADITLIANGSFFMSDGTQLGAFSGVGNAGNINIFVRDSVLLTNDAELTTISLGQGNAGNINIVAGNTVSFANGSFISAETRGLIGGNGGNINIRAGLLSIDGNTSLRADTSGRGNAGSITIDVNRLDLTRLGRVFTGSSGTGKAGDISITATDSVNVSQAFVITGSTGAGDSGNLSIRTRELNVGNGGQLSTVSAAQGDAGDIFITATDSVNLSNQGFVITGTGELSTGDSGTLFIGTGKLNVSGGGQVTTASRGTGNAGKLELAATDSVIVNSQGLVTTSSFAAGNSGNLSISTRQFNVSDSGSVVGTNSFGAGKAGDLSITNADTVTVSNQGLLSTGSLGSGNGGTLSINTRQLDVINSGGVDGGISTTAIGTGNSGNLSILATESMNVLSGGNVITSSDQGTGIAGRIDITTNRLSIRDGSRVVSSTIGAGDAGDVTIRATDSIEVVNLSTLSANTFGSGNGGDIALETRSLSVRNGGEVSTGTNFNSSGRGGNLVVTASDSVELIEGFIFTTTFGQGDSGDLSVTARKLTARDGGRVEAGTRGTGRGGDVIVNASESINLSGSLADGNILVFSAVSASSGTESIEGSGNVNLTSGQLIIQDGAEITTTTLGPGEGGDIKVQANSVSLTNSGNITSRSDGQGNGGDIQLSANSLSLKNNASISSRSDAELFNAGDAGNINLNVTGDLRSNGGIISATSEQAGGGDIKIQADDIRLRDGSLISTSVFDSTGGGGNITIDSTVFLAIEDSDILANAEAGPGGDITINSSAFLADLFSSGAAVPVGRNPGDLGQFRGNGRNDISVSAGFRGNDRVDISADSRTGTSGAVIIRGSFSERRVNPLPSWVEAEDLIDRRCAPNNSAKKSSFTITGRGGLPPNPTDPLMNDAVWVDWITLQDRQGNVNGTATDANPTHSQPTQLVEAQSWVIGSDGQVILTAAAPTVTPASSGLVVPSCEDNQAATP